MPVQKCSVQDKTGYKYSDNGKCYTGSDAKKKAFKQGLAIEISKESTKNPKTKRAEAEWRKAHNK